MIMIFIINVTRNYCSFGILLQSLRPASPSNRDAFVLVTEEGDAVGTVVDAETKQWVQSYFISLTLEVLWDLERSRWSFWMMFDQWKHVQNL